MLNLVKISERTERVIVQWVELNTEPQVIREVTKTYFLAGVLALDKQIECKSEGEDVGDPQEFQEVLCCYTSKVR